MTITPPPAWSVFKQIFADHWDGFTRAHPRYDRRYYDGLVVKMLGCGDPAQMGYIDYRCLRCGEGTHRVAMSCKSSLCRALSRGGREKKAADGRSHIAFTPFTIDFQAVYGLGCQF